MSKPDRGTSLGLLLTTYVALLAAMGMAALAVYYLWTTTG